jgi:hypothetical protein
MSLSNSPQGIPPNDRRPISLTRRLDHKLLGYTAAASAAGVGMMALAQPSQAEIVYTPANQTIATNTSFALDVNGDGIADFTISNTSRFYTGRADRNGGAFPTGGGSHRLHRLDVFPQPANRVIIDAAYYASDLRAGRKVGPLDKWDPTRAWMEICSSGSGSLFDSGPWRDVKARYLGFSFSINGQPHFGWARLNVGRLNNNNCAITAVLTGYAYETIPGRPIEAGETSGKPKTASENNPRATLGMLAQGSAGFSAWRREEKAVEDRN